MVISCVKFTAYRHIEAFFQNVIQVNGAVKQKLLDLELPLQTRATIASLGETEKEIPTLLTNTILTLALTLTILVQASRQRHQAQFEHITKLKKSLSSFQSPSRNQSLDSSNCQLGQVSGSSSQLRGSSSQLPFRATSSPSKKYDYYLKDAIFRKYPLLASGEKKEVYMKNQTRNNSILEENPSLQSLQATDKLLNHGRKDSAPGRFLQDNFKKLPTFFSHRTSIDETAQTTDVTSSIAGSRTNILSQTPDHLIQELGHSRKQSTDLPKLDSVRQTNEKTIQKTRSPKVFMESISARAQKQPVFVFSNNCAGLPSAKPVNTENVGLAPKSLTKISNLLQIEQRPLLTTQKPEIRKNFMEKMYQELLEANSMIQKARNGYYQQYLEATKEKKFPAQSTVAEGKTKRNIRPSCSLSNTTHRQQKPLQMTPKNETELNKIQIPNLISPKSSKPFRSIKLLISEKPYPTNSVAPSKKGLKNVSDDVIVVGSSRVSLQPKVTNITLEKSHEKNHSVVLLEAPSHRRAPILPEMKQSRSFGLDRYYFSKSVSMPKSLGVEGSTNLQSVPTIFRTEEFSDLNIQKTVKLRSLIRGSIQNVGLELNKGIGRNVSISISGLDLKK